MSPIELKDKKRVATRNYTPPDNFGKFTCNGTVFELESPNTPRAWYHCLSNKNYLLRISHLGSGDSCYRSAVGNQITPPVKHSNNIGRFFYIRNNTTGDFFSPMVYPTHTDIAEHNEYRCSFNIGSIDWHLQWQNIASDLTLLVCPDNDVELYLLRLTNTGNYTQTLDCFFYLEWEFGGAPTKWGNLINAYFDDKLNAQIADLQIPDKYRFHQTGFITCSQPILDFDCRKSSFLGTLGTISQPNAVINGRCSNTKGPKLGDTTCGAVRIQIDLPPNESRDIMFSVGVTENLNELKHIIPLYRNPEIFKKKKIKIQQLWQDHIDKQQICDPSETVHMFFNTWLKYQVTQNARWGRWGHYRGYRDVLQDVAGMRLLDIDSAKKSLLEAAQHQRSDGHAPRQWSVVHWKKHDWSDYRDSCFWLIYGIEAYLRETGDFDFLKQRCGFIDIPKKTTIWEHMNRTIDFLWKNRGQHGLCLTGQGDWLDSLNRSGIKGKGESVWLSQALCWALLKMGEIARKMNVNLEADKFQNYYTQLKEIINTVGWDGNWYLMGYDDEGLPVGSVKNDDGPQIFLNSQAWAIIAQIADKNRASLANKAVEQLLTDQAGYLCYTPTYSKYNHNIGRISIGSSETDAVYVHAVTFKIMADLIQGNADLAYQTIKKITPAARYLPAEVTGAEPFCYVNSFAGPGWPKPGWNSAGWFTGTASWMLQIAIEWLWGAKAEYEGLKISPCLPSQWTSARLIRHIRNSSYDITIIKPKGICSGNVELELDGVKINDNILPYFSDGKQHIVRCEITSP